MNKQFFTTAAALLILAACQPVDLDTANRCATHAPGSGTLQLDIQPTAPGDAIARVSRFVLRGDGGPLEADRVYVVEGHIGSGHLSQLERDEPSTALQERILPSLRWHQADGALVVTPLVALEAGAKYTLASGSPAVAYALTVMPDDDVPLLHLQWPPLGIRSGAEHAIWCGGEPIDDIASEALLQPLDQPSSAAVGAVQLLDQAVGRHCVRIALPPPTPDTPTLVGPALLLDGAGQPRVRLEPAPIQDDQAAETLLPMSCELGWMPFGPGCAQLADDRMRLRTPEQPLLWAVHAAPGWPQLDLLRRSQGNELLVHPLPPATPIQLHVAALDATGTRQQGSLSATTFAAMPHVIISEVMANPIGPEPAQEWVELYNDGSQAAWLLGYTLHDIGGASELPDVLLQPGEYALLVPEDFDAAADYDVPPAAGTQLVRVPKLGSNGLSNQGEPLKLYDEDGRLISRFPSQPKPKPGISVMRIHPKAMDDDPASFRRSDETGAELNDQPGATPGSPNE